MAVRKKNEEAVEPSTQDTEVVKPRRGGDRGGHFPQQMPGFGESSDDKQLIRRLLTETLHNYRKTKVKNDDELAQRFDEYYRECAEYGTIPCIEEMVLSTGYSWGHINDIEQGRNKGFTPQTGLIIKKAKEYQKTFDAKLVLSGKMPFLAYCFRAKNYYGMRDQQDIVVQPKNPLGEEQSTEQLAAKYTQGIDEGED